jgi:hypothetical protein
MPSYQSYDDALELIADAGPELRDGLTNHAPMVIEALCAMDRASAIEPWLHRYRQGFLARPQSNEPVVLENWRSALGVFDRFAGWRELLIAELRDATWPLVMDRWVARLAAGISASALHGIIRVGHATRALAQAETPIRISELADGLAYWAATYQTLPGVPELASDATAPRDAITRVPLLPLKQRKFAGTITSSLEALDGFPAFAPVLNLVRVSDDHSATVSHLAETFTRVFLANAHDPLTAIIFIHGVTSASAVRSLLPLVSPEVAHAALRYQWQAGCAIYATFATQPISLRDPQLHQESIEALIDRAVENGDEHVIKFTEACLREDEIGPSPVYRAAALHAMSVLKR